MIALIDNYDSFTYNLYQVVASLGEECRVFRNDKISVGELEALKPSALLLSPGPGNPDEAGICLEAIAHFAGKLPILGVCLGHQVIGQAFGGAVVRAERMMHGKASRIHHDEQGVYRGLKNPFTGTRYHSLVVDRKSLPSELTISAETKDGVIMGLRHKTLPIEGVQFHPESILTDEGQALLANFLKVAAA